MFSYQCNALIHYFKIVLNKLQSFKVVHHFVMHLVD